MASKYCVNKKIKKADEEKGRGRGEKAVKLIEGSEAYYSKAIQRVTFTYLVPNDSSVRY